MELSFHSGFTNDLFLLMEFYKDENELSNAILNIECYYKNVDDKTPLSVIRFSTDYGWFETNPIKKYGGDILDKSVSVKLKDFFNVVENCVDEIISLNINKVNKKLNIYSFYNDVTDMDELFVEMNIIDMWDGCRENIKPKPNSKTEFYIDNVTYWFIVNDLALKNKAKKLDFIFEKNILKCQCKFDDVYASLTFKNQIKIVGDNLRNFSIPFGFFDMVFKTGFVSPICFSLTDTHVYVDVDKYHFMCPIDFDVEPYFDKKITTQKLFIVEKEDFVVLLTKILKITETNKAKFKKISDGICELSCDVKNDYHISLLTYCATYSDSEIEFDPKKLLDIINSSNIDAFSINKTQDDKCFYLNYETHMYEKTVTFNIK